MKKNNLFIKITVSVLVLSMLIQSEAVNVYALSEEQTEEEYEITENNIIFEEETAEEETAEEETSEEETAEEGASEEETSEEVAPDEDTSEENGVQEDDDVILEDADSDADSDADDDAETDAEIKDEEEQVEGSYIRSVYGVSTEQVGNAIKVTWLLSSGSSDGYVIYRAEDGKAPQQIARVANANAQEYTDNTAKKKVLYRYYVAAYYNGSEGSRYEAFYPAMVLDEVKITSVTTAYDAISDYNNTGKDNCIVFIWKKSNDVDGYEAYQDNGSIFFSSDPEIKENKGELSIKVKGYNGYNHSDYVIRSYIKSVDKEGGECFVYSAPTRVSDFAVPEAPNKLFSGISRTSSKIKLQWNKCNNVSGYEILKYNKSKKKYVKVKTLAATKSSWTDTGLKADKAYKYAIRAYYNSEWGKVYTKDSVSVTVYTLPKSSKINALNKKIKNGAKAVISSASFRGGSSANTNTDYTGAGSMRITTYNSLGRYGYVSTVSDFIDNKGRYTVASYDNSYVYITIVGSKLKPSKTIKIKRKYSKVGGVTCDSSGNYYVAWGDYDTAGNGGKVTFAISKYSSKGKYRKTASFKGRDGYWDTREAFHAGNCSMIVNKGTLICTYAKLMYSGHQANAVFCVNTKNMKVVGDPNGNSGYRSGSYCSYTSHSFDESVISLSDGRVAFVDLGDAYPRGFSITVSDGNGKQSEYVPFHFYGETGDNTTNACLGGIAEVSTGIALVGTSGKSLNNISDTQQVFLQIINPDTGKSVLKGKSRSGTSCGSSVKDTGIIWLTGSSSSIRKPHVAALSKDRVAVFWQNLSGETFYTVVSATGKILQKTTSMGYVGLNGCEEMKVYKDYAYWSTAENGLITAHKMKIGKVK